MDKRFLTLAQTAERYGVCRQTIWRRLSEGAFPQPLKIGRALRWRVEDLAAWEQQQVDGQAETYEREFLT